MGIEAAFVAVGSFITAGAATGAVAAVVGGVVIGAVAGGLVAAVTGGDILKGALIGGALGGLAGWASTGFAMGGAGAGGGAGGAAAETGAMTASDASWAGINADITAGGTTTSGLEAAGGGAANLVANPGTAPASEGFLSSLTAKDAIAPTLTLVGDTIKGYGEGMAADAQANAQSKADDLAYQRSLRTNSGLSDMPWAPTEISKTMTQRLEDMTGVLNLNDTGLLAQAAPKPAVVAQAPTGAQVANPMGTAVAPQPIQQPQGLLA